MGAAAGVAGVASLASIGLSAAGSVMKGAGTQAADDMQADQAQQAAEFARTQASLTDTTLRQRLNMTLSNIDAIRASGGVDPSSPTTAAVEDWNKQLSDTQRLAQDVLLRTQAATDDAGARYLRSAGSYAMTQGIVGAGISLAGGAGRAFAPGGSMAA